MNFRHCLPTRRRHLHAVVIPSDKCWCLPEWQNNQLEICIDKHLTMECNLWTAHNSRYMCVYVYIYVLYIIFKSLGGWRLPEIHEIPCGTAICCDFGACFSQTANIQHIDITWYYLCLMAFFCLPKTVPKSHFGACLGGIPRSVSSRWLKPQQTARLWKNTKISWP